MDYAFILDPLPELKAYKDSSVAMMRSLAARGHAIYALRQSLLLGVAPRWLAYHLRLGTEQSIFTNCLQSAPTWGASLPGTP